MLDLRDLPTPEIDNNLSGDEDESDFEPCFARSNDQSYSKLSHTQLSQLIRDPSSFDFERIIIIDARYPYEYENGKIINAMNVQSLKKLDRIFQNNKKNGKKTAVIFHCEFSRIRGPKVMSIFRKLDRERNEYPNLFFPHVFLLEGGYKTFFEKHRDLCVGGYVQMKDSKYRNQLQSCTTFFRKYMLCEKCVRTVKLFGSQEADYPSTRSLNRIASYADLNSAMCFSQPIFYNSDF